MAYRVNVRRPADTLFAYCGFSLLVLGVDGTLTGEGQQGLYFDNTRFLRRIAVTALGWKVEPIAASAAGAGGALAYFALVDPSHPDAPTTSLESCMRISDGLRQELRVTGHASKDVALTLALHLEPDFEDAEEVRQGKRRQDAPVETTWDAARQEVVFRYRHPRLSRALAVRVEQAPPGVTFEGGALRFPMTLVPQVSTTIAITFEPIVDGHRRAAASANAGLPDGLSSFARIERARRRLRADLPELVTDNHVVDRSFQTAVEDLVSLPLGLPEGPAAPLAGVPRYQQIFGRDSLIIGWQAAMVAPEILRDALRVAAAFQGTERNDDRDEEPGKLLHQMRFGPLSVLGLDPYLRYYGDYTAPPLFLSLLYDYLAWTGDLATIRELLPAARKVLAWLDRDGDADKDGFLEYKTRSSRGLRNQGWKDSDDAIQDRQGHIIDPPIATCEIQGHWYGGLTRAAAVFLRAGEVREAYQLFQQATALRRRFDQAFWMEDDGYYALALGPDKQPIRSIASNAGHALTTGIATRERAQRVARRLMEPDLWSGWGIRTLSSHHVAYDPWSYHLGSVWPVENAAIAWGLGRYGYIAELHQVAEGFFAATDLFPDNRLPETLSGVPRDARHVHPGVYPEADRLQGWSASAVVQVMQSLLGLRPLAPLGILRVDPRLPPWLPHVRLLRLRVGDTRLDLDFERDRSGKTLVHVLRREGFVQVVGAPRG